MKTYKIVELLGDGISTELSQAVHSLAETLPCRRGEVVAPAGRFSAAVLTWPAHSATFDTSNEVGTGGQGCDSLLRRSVD